MMQTKRNDHQPAVHQCPVCHQPQIKIQRRLGATTHGSIIDVLRTHRRMQHRNQLEQGGYVGGGVMIECPSQRNTGHDPVAGARRWNPHARPATAAELVADPDRNVHRSALELRSAFDDRRAIEPAFAVCAKASACFNEATGTKAGVNFSVARPPSITLDAVVETELRRNCVSWGSKYEKSHTRRGRRDTAGSHVSGLPRVERDDDEQDRQRRDLLALRVVRRSLERRTARDQQFARIGPLA